MSRAWRGVRPVAIALLAFCVPAAAAETGGAEPLPDPLTVEQALALADSNHPTVEEAEARYELSRAFRDRLAVEKGSGQRLAVAEAELECRKSLHEHARQHHRLEIVRHFFDVLLADLRHARDNEAMAIAFVQFDRARERNLLGQVSDIDLAALESGYQTVRARVFRAQAEQRASRSRLALGLHRPDELPSNLVAPALSLDGRSRPELAELESAVLADNLRLRAGRACVRATELQLEAARAGETVLVQLDNGAHVSVDIAPDEAEFMVKRRRARLAQRELKLRQKVLETWLELESLNIQHDEAAVLGDYRELYLDRSRALYEHEVRTDLGDAMVQTSAARLRAAETEYAMALAWARLDVLRGKDPVLGTE